MRVLRLTLTCCCMLAAGCGDVVQVSESGFGAFEPALAVVDGGLAVAWSDNRAGNDEIFLRLLDDELLPVSAELRLTHNPHLSYEAALAVFAGKLAIAWYDRDPAGKLAVMLGLWNMDGSAEWSQRISSEQYSGRIPVLQAGAEGLFIAWVEDADEQSAPSTLYGAWFDVQGGRVGETIAIAAASRSTWNLNADALFDGRIALVFDAQTETLANELYLALVGARDSSVFRLTADDGFASKYPDIALHENLSALTWFDVKDGNEEVYLAPLDVFAPQYANVEFDSRRITRTAGESIGAYVAWNGDALGLAWNDDYGGQHEVYFQRFNNNFQPLDASRQLSHTSAESLIPAIVAHGRGFALAWNEVVLGEGGHASSMNDTRSEIVVTTVE